MSTEEPAQQSAEAVAPVAVAEPGVAATAAAPAEPAEPAEPAVHPAILASNGKLEACMVSMHDKFKEAGSKGEEVAKTQEGLIRKMLEGARRDPVVGGEKSLKDYLEAAQLFSVFEPFIAELAKELAATCPSAQPKKKAKKKDTRLYCVCNQMYDEDGEGMIGCDSCSDWFHFSCIGITEAESLDPDFNYTCEICKEREKKDRRKFREEQAQEEESEEEDFSEGSDDPISDASDLDDDGIGDY